MNPQQELALLEQLIDELLAGLQDTIQSGEILSDDFQGAIAQELEATTQRIDQLRGEIGQQQQGQPQAIEQGATANMPPSQPPTGGNIPPLEPAPHPSSNINAFRYDPQSKRLFIKFQGTFPQQNGPVYKYEGVPQNIFNVFQRGSVAPRTSGRNAWHRWQQAVTPSHGASAYALIREGGYPYQRMS